MKKILIILLVIVVLIVIAVALLFSNLDSIVAKAIEKNGSNVTKTSVRVADVDLSLREGRGTVKGLTVASPHGFEARDAFALDEITLDIDIESLRGDPIIIDEIRIKAPVVNAEITKTGASNIEKIRENVKAYTAGGETRSRGQAKRVRIKSFVFEQGRVEIDVSALGLENRTIELPEIRLSDIGGENGAPPDEIAKIILMEVGRKVSQEIAGSQLDRMIQEKLGGSIKDKAKGLIDKIR